MKNQKGISLIIMIIIIIGVVGIVAMILDDLRADIEYRNKINTEYEAYKASFHTITFDTDGGDPISPIEAQTLIGVSDKWAHKDGYIFKGWLLDGQPIDSLSSKDLTQDVTLKASYSQPHIYNIGEKITTAWYEITVTNVEQKSTVGTTYLEQQAGEGNTYVCCSFKIKNISNKPKDIFSQPTFNLVDSKNITYNSDISASSYYSVEVNSTDKIFSDLNPGVTITDACVFELGREYFSQNTFNLKISADHIILVKIK